jgi:DNA-binding response OmpR family regulator
MNKPRPPSVLVVDDERLLARSIVRLLEREGWQAEACYDSREALERSQNATFDVVVVDWGIPGPRGAVLIDHLRLNWPECRLVVTSADSSQPLGHATVRAHGIPCLSKPFSFEELKAVILGCLS